MSHGKELSLIDGKFSLVPRNLTEAMEFAKMISVSDVCPKQYKGKAGDIVIAVQLGQEIGLPPMRALQFIAVINGNPTAWGQGCASLIVASPHCEYLKLPSVDDIKKGKKAVVAVKRRGHPETVGTFDAEDAKLMRLESKNTYQTNWPDMYLWRAFHRATKIVFSDVLNGIIPREVAEDYEVVATTEQGHEVMVPRRKSETIKDATATVTEPNPPADPEPPASDKPKISDPQRKRLFAIAHNSGRADDEIKMHLKEVYGIESSKDITTDIYDAVVAWAEKGAKAEPGSNG